jgi:hypothetical protein
VLLCLYDYDDSLVTRVTKGKGKWRVSLLPRPGGHTQTHTHTRARASERNLMNCWVVCRPFSTVDTTVSRAPLGNPRTSPTTTTTTTTPRRRQWELIDTAETRGGSSLFFFWIKFFLFLLDDVPASRCHDDAPRNSHDIRPYTMHFELHVQYSYSCAPYAPVILPQLCWFLWKQQKTKKKEIKSDKRLPTHKSQTSLLQRSSTL